MLFAEIIQPDSVLCNARARSKKHCFEILSELLVRANPQMSKELIFAGLIERERLGCTDLDCGVAFPHCRIDGLDAACAALIRLSDPLHFDATDGEPVDLVFGMMVPAELGDADYADIEAVTSALCGQKLRDRLRTATSDSALYTALVGGVDRFGAELKRAVGPQ